jgi:TolB-like protein
MRNLAILLLSLILTGCAGLPTISATNKVDLDKVGVIAVLPFNGFNGESFSDSITAELIRKGARVVDRAKVSAILAEQGLSVSSITTGGVSLNKLGGLLGVDVIIAGSVSPIIVYASGAPSGKVSSATARLVSVKNGEILSMATFEANTELLMGSELYPRTAKLLVDSLSVK